MVRFVMPLKSYSWTVYDKNTAVKRTDLSIFKNYGSTIPVVIRPFFSIDSFQKGETMAITLSLNEKTFQAKLERIRSSVGQTRIMWNSEFSNYINNLFPNVVDTHNYPELVFHRIDASNYEVTFRETNNPMLEADVYSNHAWIVPINPSFFNIDQAIIDSECIVWQKRNIRYSNKDLVFFYITSPVNKIKYKGVVVDNEYNDEDCLNEKYWIKPDEYQKGKDHYVKIQIIDSVDDDRLLLNHLKEQGLTTVQWPSRATDSLISYIESILCDRSIEYPDRDDDEYFMEGSKKSIYVSKYERNPGARLKCIQKNGTRCHICNMDFGETYGDFAKGFIHVHHIVPIHEIGENYKIDPERELLPVCPNCHAMLHHKREDGSYYLPDELKRVLEKRRKSDVSS